jgi:hypothetical protein
MHIYMHTDWCTYTIYTFICIKFAILKFLTIRLMSVIEVPAIKFVHWHLCIYFVSSIWMLLFQAPIAFLSFWYWGWAFLKSISVFFSFFLSFFLFIYSFFIFFIKNLKFIYFYHIWFLQGYVVVDRDGKHFRHILNWLRDGVVPTLKDSEYSELLREAEYYQLLVSNTSK